MLHTIEVYFLLFMTYAIMGWCMEVTCKWFQYKRFINRGFLLGPYCPIYGWGGVAITILLQKYLPDPLALFVFAMIICSILEYLTSYVMEKKYHARWWDYSQKKFNINGRICLGTMIPFGLLGLFISYIASPFFIGIYDGLPNIAIHIISAVLLVVFVTDNIISGNVINSVKNEVEKVDKDNTEEIVKKVKERLANKKGKWAHRRLLNAYPHLTIVGKLKNKKQKVEEKFEEEEKKIEEKIENKKEIKEEKK